MTYFLFLRKQAFQVMLSGLIFTTSQITSAQTVSCTAGGPQKQTKHDFSRGIDRSLYAFTSGESFCPLDKCASSAAAREETRELAFMNAFELVDQMGRTYLLARPYYLEGFRRLLETGDPAILKEDVILLKATETYDTRRCEYKYNVDIAVLKLPRLPHQINSSLRRFLKTIRPKHQANSIALDLSVILVKLSSDRDFAKSLQAASQDMRFRSALRYKDDDTQFIIEALQGRSTNIPAFARGQYSISAFVGSVVEGAVAPEILGYLEEYARLEVVCAGTTDDLGLAAALRYDGEARMDHIGQKLELKGEGGSPIEPAINSNVGLSFARGYEGSKALAQILGPAMRSGRITIYYTGHGTSATRPVGSPEHRRIVYTISLGQKLR